MENKKKKIISVMPVTNLFARYKDEEGKEFSKQVQGIIVWSDGVPGSVLITPITNADISNGYVMLDPDKPTNEDEIIKITEIDLK